MPRLAIYDLFGEVEIADYVSVLLGGVWQRELLVSDTFDLLVAAGGISALTIQFYTEAHAEVVPDACDIAPDGRRPCRFTKASRPRLKPNLPFKRACSGMSIAIFRCTRSRLWRGGASFSLSSRSAR